MDVILFILLLVVGFNFGGRIASLEAKIKLLEKTRLKSNLEEEVLTSDSDSVEFEPYVKTNELKIDNLIPRGITEEESFSINNWLKEDLMMKLGAFLLILAFGWFVSYAIVSEWIGPVGQITLGLLVGLAFLIIGVWRIQKIQNQGGIFAVLGATIVMMTTFAAREVYDLFTPNSALLLMFLTIAFIAFLSVRYRNEKIAYAGLVMANIAPLLTNSVNPSEVGLFSYLLVVTAGALWVVWSTGWTRIILASLVMTYSYSLAFIDSYLVDKDILLFFAFVFVSIYFVANVISLVRRNAEKEQHINNHIFTALGTLLFLLTWVQAAVAAQWISLVYIAWALVFAVGTYVVYSSTSNLKAFYLYGATSIALIGIATAVELDGPVLTLAFLLEVSLLIIASIKVGVSNKTLSYLSLLLFIPIITSVESFSIRHWDNGLFNQHALIIILIALSTLGVGLLLSQRKVEGDSKLVSNIMLLISGFYSLSFVWLSLHSLFSDTFATTLSLVIYTLAGIALFVNGTAAKNKAMSTAGSIIIGLVIARLLLIDVWMMSLEARIFTFLAVGILLISTAFIKKHRQPNNEELIN